MMSSYTELLSYTRQLERRLAALERLDDRAVTDHALLDGLAEDGHPQYLYASGGKEGATNQVQLFTYGVVAANVYGGIGPNDDLTIEGTTDAAKTTSDVLIQPTAGNVGIFRSPTSSRFEIGASTRIVYDTITTLTVETTSFSGADVASRFDVTTDVTNVNMSLRLAKGIHRYTSNATTVAFLHYGSAVDQFELVHGSNTRLAVASNGNVGIGQGTAAEKLEVAGNILIPNNSWYKAKSSGGTAIWLMGIDASNNVYMGAVSDAGGSVYIREDGANVVTITGANVGVGGAPSATARLTAKGSTTDYNGNALYLTDSANTALFTFRNDGVSYFANGQYLSPDGNAYTRWWTPGVALGALSYMGQYGHVLSYNVKLTAGAWKSIAASTGGCAFAFTEGNFTLANTNSFSGADQAVTWYDRLVVTAAGDVGIGTAAPDGRLHVVQNGSTAGIRVTGGTNPQIAAIDGSLTMKVQSAGTLGIFGTESNHPCAIYTNNTNRVHIPADGNVGIGTTTPASYLSGTSGISVYNASYPGISWVNTSAYWLMYMSSSNLYIWESTNATNRVTFQTNGNVGIGTSSPNDKLEISGGDLSFSNGGSATSYIKHLSTNSLITFRMWNGASNVDVLTCRPEGVGIGTTSVSSNSILTVGGRVGIKTGANAVAAQMMVYQDSTTAAIAVVDLVQDDISEEFINFRSGEGTGYPADTAAVGSYAKKVRVSVNGTFYWLALYN